MVRPESIHVGRSARGAEGSLRGRIVQTSFLGSQTRIAVSCDGLPEPLTASQFGRERIAALDLTPDREVVALVGRRRCCRYLPHESIRRRTSDVSITEGRLTRADLLKAGAAGALGLYVAGSAGARTHVRGQSDDAEHAHLVGSLRERPAEGGQQGHRGSRAGRRCSATTPTRT